MFYSFFNALVPSYNCIFLILFLIVVENVVIVLVEAGVVCRKTIVIHSLVHSRETVFFPVENFVGVYIMLFTIDDFNCVGVALFAKELCGDAFFTVYPVAP